MTDSSSVQRLLFEAAPQAYLALSAEPDFTILFANAKYLAMTGAQRESLIGRPLFAALQDLPFDHIDLDDLRASLDRTMRSGAPDDMGLRQFRRSDERGGYETRTWKGVNTPVLDETGRIAFILCHIEDVTPQTSADASLEGAESELIGSVSDVSARWSGVVIAESSAEARDRLDGLLKKSGFETLPVAGAEAAMAACFAARPALLLGTNSQDIDAIALTRRLRVDERTAALPIMILSERAGEDARIEAYEAGVDEYLETPISARELIARIQSVVRLAGARANIAGRERRVAVLSRLASVVETAMDAVISVDSKQRITLFNAAAEKMFGFDALSALGRPLEDLIPARFRTAHAKHVEAFGRTGVSGRTMGRLGDLTALRADGVEFPIEASISQARVEGELLFTVIVRDISERHAAVETQRLLMGELDHRVKNTLAMVQAIASQTAKAYGDPKDFAESFNGRVRAMASAHTLLTRTAWKGADLCDLLREQLTLGADSRVVVSGPDVFLEPQIALHFGMVLYELGSNARKYGALSRDDGRIEVHWAVETIENAPFLAFDWGESGGPPTKPPSQRHFGTRLIEFSLTHSLHGEVQLDFAPAGLRCRIRLPLGQSVFLEGVGKILEE